MIKVFKGGKKKQNSETLKHRLEKRVRTEKIRFYFRLPAGEMLDGKTDCVLHASYERNRAESGTLYVFKNFLCFKSTLPNLLSLVVPLRFVTHVEGKKKISTFCQYFLRINLLTKSNVFNQNPLSTWESVY